MDKIIETINSMITNKDKITDIRRSNDTYFFRYLGYIFSISSFNNSYDLVLYPDPSTNYNQVASGDPFAADPKFLYKSSDFKAREAIESFRELYQLVKGKNFNIDSILDRIIRG